MARSPWIFAGIWIVLVIGGVTWHVLAPSAPVMKVGSFLPPDAPHNQARRLMLEAFPQLASRSEIVLIAYRQGGLAEGDFDYFGAVVREAADVADGRVLSPTVGYLKPRLVSSNGEAALGVFNLKSNFISKTSQDAVERVEKVARDRQPGGLVVEITGTAGGGRDYALATEDALHNTTWVTVIAVLLILIAVYRSPVGALVPLVAIGASVYLAMILLGLLERAGWHVSDMERVFAVVLLFGAGVDYALFWIARYREELQEGKGLDAACERATAGTSPAILASAATTICGLTTMISTDLVPTQNAGKQLGLVLIIALLAALTLSPALARLLGRVLFWPRGFEAGQTVGQRFVWGPLADGVTRRPGFTLAAGLVVMSLLAGWALRIQPRFDALSELPPGSSSDRGYELAREHFAKGQLYSNTLLLKFGEGDLSGEEGRELSGRLSEEIAAIEGVYDVYSLNHPLGRQQGESAAGAGALLSRLARAFYLSAEPSVLRLEILVDHHPFSPEAMSIIDRVRALGEAEARQWGGQQVPQVLMSGPTPYVIGVREVVGKDQVRVMILATLVIGLIVFVMVRDLPLTGFMLLSTWLTYGVALTLSQLFFVHVLGEPGMDYKVRIIVFVIVVAVGQDYNIFLVSRLLQEPMEISDTEATRRAIIRTGSVISSCGLIMAATLGSLWAGGLNLLQQLGFTLAAGILIDTFFVRPLLIPSFFLAARRRRALSRQRGAFLRQEKGQVDSVYQ